jgi:hypothetical protein
LSISHKRKGRPGNSGGLLQGRIVPTEVNHRNFLGKIL